MAHRLLKQWAKARLVAVLRAKNVSDALAQAQHLRLAGIDIIEVTLTFEGAFRAVELIGSPVGCGTVLTVGQAQEAVRSGAQFLVSPYLHPGIIRVGQNHDLMVVGGAWTPNEIYTAQQLECDVIKLYPAQVGGPAYLANVRQIFPEVAFFPCGGVTLASAKTFLQAGAVAVGIGQGLSDVPDLPNRITELM